MSWILGLSLTAAAIGIVWLCLQFAHWMNRCPRCKSVRGARIKSWRNTDYKHIEQRECGRCGHQWETSGYNYSD